MLRKVLTLLAAVVALGLTFGSTSNASAHVMRGSAAGCCGPVKPIFHHIDKYKSYHVNVHVPVYKTVHFIRPRQVYDVTHLHVTKYVHRIIDTHVTRVGHIRDVVHHAVIPVTRVVVDTRRGITTVRCFCGPHRSTCR